MNGRYLVYVVQKSKDSETSWWNRAGVAFTNRDGSINLKLDLFPGVDFQLREPAEKNGNGNGHGTAEGVRR